MVFNSFVIDLLIGIASFIETLAQTTFEILLYIGSIANFTTVFVAYLPGVLTVSLTLTIAIGTIKVIMGAA